MAARQTNWRNLILVVSLGILIAVQLFGVALASGWALAGLFELGPIVEAVMELAQDAGLAMPVTRHVHALTRARARSAGIAQP
ncbi:MAG: hypothetical protein ACOVOI_03365 [Hyphomicrobiales bacterium]